MLKYFHLQDASILKCRQILKSFINVLITMQFVFTINLKIIQVKRNICIHIFYTSYIHKICVTLYATCI